MAAPWTAQQHDAIGARIHFHNGCGFSLEGNCDPHGQAGTSAGKDKTLRGRIKSP